MPTAGNRPWARRTAAAGALLTSLCVVTLPARMAPPPPTTIARDHGVEFERAVAASHRLFEAWMKSADPKTLLLPDRLDEPRRIYNPHNSARICIPI